MSPPPLLSLLGVTKRFGGVAALTDVSFDVPEGSVLGVIGPNGAGKTTLLNCVSGVYGLDEGEIALAGQRIDGRRPHEIARFGIGRTFQIVKPFASMTVRENAAVGAIFGSTSARMRTPAAFRYADEVLELVGLAPKAALPVANLTVPDRKRLEVARALCTRPKLLLLDEVMAGLNAVEVGEALEMVRKVHRSGVTIVLIEHVMQVIVGVCTDAVVLHLGRVLVTGKPQEVLRDRRVIEAYLGQRYAQRHAQGDGAGSDG